MSTAGRPGEHTVHDTRTPRGSSTVTVLPPATVGVADSSRTVASALSPKVTTFVSPWLRTRSVTSRAPASSAQATSVRAWIAKSVSVPTTSAVPEKVSGWSSSAFNTTATSGRYRDTLRSDSSPSAISRPEPACPLTEPTGAAPAAHDGFRCPTATASIAVAVDLPCVPDTTTDRSASATSCAMTCERWATATPAARAATISGLAASMTLDHTTTDAPATFAASCPARTRQPAASSWAATSPVFTSEPDTCAPRPASRRASADMPAPQIPTK